MRRLAAYWYQGEQKVRIGTLVEAPRGLIAYEWDRDFLINSIELSPLNFKKTPSVIECKRDLFDGLPGLFSDSVPDGWGKVLLRHGLEAKGVLASAISPLDALAFIGHSGMGALAFEPELRGLSKWAEGKISLADLERGIEPILNGTPSAVIEAFIENGASPNGMRPKIILKESKGKFYTASSPEKGDEWLIKFQAPEDPKGIGKLEYVYSLMAKASGLDMPETRLFKSEGKYYFGVKRFDRTVEGRVHVHTLSGMLHSNPANFAVDYEHFAKAAQLLTKDIREVEKVIRIAAFNVLSCNQDDHAKNVAFLMAKDGSWQVAPAYDLTYHKTRFSEHKMMLRGNGKPAEKDLLDFAKFFGFSSQKSKSLIDEVKEAISKFKKLSSEYEIPKVLAKEVSLEIDSRITRKKGLI
jgi:serine/threonine-protein kinase HipA